MADFPLSSRTSYRFLTPYYYLEKNTDPITRKCPVGWQTLFYSTLPTPWRSTKWNYSMNCDKINVMWWIFTFPRFSFFLNIMALNMKVELMEAWIHLFLKHIAINFRSDQLMKDKFISDQLLFDAGLAINSMEWHVLVPIYTISIL